MRLAPVILAGTSLLLAGAGCETSYPSLTCGLWTGNTLRSFNEPAGDPGIRVYESPRRRDFLVTYDESMERNDAIRRRAFYLRANLDRLNTGRKPRFVSPTKTNGLTLLHLRPAPTAGSAGSDGQLAASDRGAVPDVAAPTVTPAVTLELESADGRVFAVAEAGGARQTFELPTYPAIGGEIVRVLITPLAVVGDTVIAASVVGLVVAVAASRSGTTYSP